MRRSTISLKGSMAIAKDFNPVSTKVSSNETESLAIWKGRKSAFGAVGQISPDYLCMDGTIPTSQPAGCAEGHPGYCRIVMACKSPTFSTRATAIFIRLVLVQREQGR